MLIDLANHNPDIQQLMDARYALRYDEKCLVLRDVPYLDHQGTLQWGAMVSKLVFVNKTKVKQDDHQIYFAGSPPHGIDGSPIPNLAGGPCTIELSKSDVVVQRSFSNKPDGGFSDLFKKFEHYLNLISGPAVHKFGANPFTARVDSDVVPDSVFHYQDTLTSRAEVGHLVAPMKNDIIAVIGLGGTGFFIVDFMVRTPVREIRGFDADEYYVHNAYRSPGKLDEEDLGLSKAEVCRRRYDGFRKHLTFKDAFIDLESAELLKGVTFAYVCVDKGSARAEIFELLIQLGIPFIDVGMGLNRDEGALAGTIRATYYPPDKAREMLKQNLAELVDDPDDEYRKQVQLSELNAFNASLAVMRYKQLRGFYVDKAPDHLLFNATTLRIAVAQDEDSEDES